MAAANYSPPAEALIKATRADFDRRDVVQPVHLVQYDDTLPVLAVALYKGGQPWTLPTGADVNLRMDKKDGHYVYNPALGVSSDRATVYLAVTAQMTTGYGTFAPVVEVLAGGGVAGMAALRLDIDKNPVQDGMLESTDEYKTVQVLAAEVAANAKIVRDNEAGIQDVHENIEAIKAAPANATAAAASAKEARSWAVGDTASRPGEGMDNAKYYAALAQQISQGAKGFYPTYKALNEAHPTGKDGDWAIVGTTDTIWTWDSDTENWFDSGNAAKFTNYYDKTQIDAMLAAMKSKLKTVTVAASAWTTGSYSVTWDDGSTTSYTACATVTVAGVTADSRIAVSDRTRVTDAVRMVAALEPGAGVVKFYANAAPTSAAVFVLEVSQG